MIKNTLKKTLGAMNTKLCTNYDWKYSKENFRSNANYEWNVTKICV